MKNLVTTDQSKKIEIEQLKFRRDKHNWTVRTDIINQEYGFVYDKRFLCPDFTTIPFGF